MENTIETRSESREMNSVLDAMSELRFMVEKKYLTPQQKELAKKKAIMLQNKAGELLSDMGVEHTTAEDKRVSQIIYRWGIEYAREVYKKLK